MFADFATLVSIDGTDCPIEDPGGAEFYSHKLNGAGLRYEVAIDIERTFIVWTNGGFPCGANPDITIARSEFVYQLLDNERAVADDGYRDMNYFVFPAEFPHDDALRTALKSILSRHETLHTKLKSFNVLKTPFRHQLEFHPPCFYAVLTIVQMGILFGNEPLYGLEGQF